MGTIRRIEDYLYHASSSVKKSKQKQAKEGKILLFHVESKHMFRTTSSSAVMNPDLRK
jgi:hypothetical protein